MHEKEVLMRRKDNIFLAFCLCWLVTVHVPEGNC